MKTQTVKAETGAPVPINETRRYIVSLPMSGDHWMKCSDREALARMWPNPVRALIRIAEEVEGRCDCAAEPWTYELRLLIRLTAGDAARFVSTPVDESFTFKPVRMVRP